MRIMAPSERLLRKLINLQNSLSQTPRVDFRIVVVSLWVNIKFDLRKSISFHNLNSASQKGDVNEAREQLNTQDSCKHRHHLLLLSQSLILISSILRAIVVYLTLCVLAENPVDSQQKLVLLESNNNNKGINKSRFVVLCCLSPDTNCLYFRSNQYWASEKEESLIKKIQIADK